MTSLYEQIGGEAAVDATVEAFYDLVLKDELLRPFFKNTNMKRQRGMQKQFLNHVLGGKPYNGMNMRAAHAKLHLTDEHFNRVAKLLGDAMASLGVPKDKIDAILAIAETTRDDVLGRDPQGKTNNSLIYGSIGVAAVALFVVYFIRKQ